MQQYISPLPRLIAGLLAAILPLAVVASTGCQSAGAGGTDAAAGDAGQSEQTVPGFTPNPGPDVVADTLARALGEQLTVWKRPDGSRIHIAHCRRAEGGCRARIEALSKLLVESARKYDIDPFLLAAMAIRESGLHPEAVGIRGSGGILQLNPRGVGHDVRVVRDRRYLRQCSRTAAACQGPVIEIGAKHLADWIEECDNLRKALGGYNTGKCQINRYPGKVLRMRKKLQKYARLEMADDDQSS